MSSQTDEPLSSDEAARNWIVGHHERWDSGTAFSWAILRDDAVVGSVTIGSVDRHHGLGWMSYWATASSRGSGIASSALRCASDRAFRELRLFRLELGHRPGSGEQEHSRSHG